VWPALVVLLASLNAHGGGATDAGALAQIREMLDQPDQQLDLAKAKLAIDQMIDPRVEPAAALKQLDAIVAQVKARLPARASSRDKFEALRAYLYQADPSNGHRPFAYDFQDPQGRNIHNKLLSTYLATKKGNCVSMPLLFIILGQRLGIEVTASAAPEHIFVKFRDDAGNWLNVEATSGGGFTSDSWIQHEMPMSAHAIASGIYLQPLTKKETVVLMLGTLMEHLRQLGLLERSVELATLALTYYPRDISSMLHLGASNGQLLWRDCASKYSRPRDVPQERRDYCSLLNQNVRAWRAKAEALGWREPPSVSPAIGTNSLPTVGRAKPVQ
jgi:regulator of sirC expression with transglutaminase-like and TPR domain